MHPQRLEYDGTNCSIARSLGVVGEKWTLLVLREAFYGVRRFADFHTALGCARNLLADRLRTLVSEGLMTRAPYVDAHGRERQEYRLTAKGADLFPVVVALMNWGDRWLASETGPAVHLSHHGCGQPVSVQLACESGHTSLGAGDVDAAPGPGSALLDGP